MRFFVFVILKIRHAQRPCTLSPMLINEFVAKKFAKQYKMESSSSERDLVVLSLLKKKKRKRKYWVHPILRLRREEGEFLPAAWLSRAFQSLLQDVSASVWCFATGTIWLYIVSFRTLSFSATALCCRRRRLLLNTPLLFTPVAIWVLHIVIFCGISVWYHFQ